VAFLNWRFELTQMTAWRIEVAPVPDLSNVATPTRAIITIPITLYGYGNGDDAEEVGAEPCVDERVSRHNLHPFKGRHTSGLGGFQDTVNTVENAHPRPP
jgi:hypothetical protein